MGAICFERLAGNGPKIFGFSEFLAALALMVLCWTIADFRYRFRIRTAPIPLQWITFFLVGAIGLLTLLTDWWRAEQWLVPRGRLITPAAWQVILGLAFLCTFMTWAWFAFMRSAHFGIRNARRFGGELYRTILRGSPVELPEVADELIRSARALVQFAWQEYRTEPSAGWQPSRRLQAREDAKKVAQEIMLLIADRRFCRTVVKNSPATALALFREMVVQEHLSVPLDIFAKNITSAAIVDRESFAYQEISGYYTGLFGMQRPLTNTLYGNYNLVRALGTVFDVDYREQQIWDPDQWKAFFRLVIVTLADCVSKDLWELPQEIHRVMSNEEFAHFDLQRLNGTLTDWWSNPNYQRFRVSVDFAKEILKTLNKGRPASRCVLRNRDAHDYLDFYEALARMISHLIFNAATVQGPQELCWAVQHNMVWGDFFEQGPLRGSATKLVRFKVRRMLYAEVRKLGKYPNYVGARVLGLLFNVLGFDEARYSYTAETRPLQRAVLAWTRRHYAIFADDNPRLAAASLVEGITFDSEKYLLTRTGMQLLDREPHRSTLLVDRPSRADDNKRA